MYIILEHRVSDTEDKLIPVRDTYGDWRVFDTYQEAVLFTEINAYQDDDFNTEPYIIGLTVNHADNAERAMPSDMPYLPDTIECRRKPGLPRTKRNP